MKGSPHCIYEGTIRHRRFLPVENQFKYRVFFMYLDLDRLSELSGIHPLWSGKGVNLAYFRRRDHMGSRTSSLADTIREKISIETGKYPAGKICMLAHLRYFGLCFNPASFFYCYDANDEYVDTIGVEVHNTPWGQVHFYILPAEKNEHSLDQWRRHRLSKVFHVSPFMDMDVQYDWRFRLPGEKLSVHMINFQKGKRLFDASLSLEKKRVTRQQLTRVLLHYPAMTVKVVSLIYWQALKLLLKGAPFFTHPEKK